MEDTPQAAELDFEEKVLLELLRELQSRKRLEQRVLAIEDLFGGPPPEGLSSTYDRAFARCQKPGCCLYLRVVLTDQTPVWPSHGVDHDLEFNRSGLVLSDEQGQKIKFNVDNTSLQNIQPSAVFGIVPVIINITPIPNFAPLLGLADDASKEQISQL